MRLDVPGAALYYETAGSGPALLMIPGGPTDGRAFAGLAPLLTATHTVVTYDPRGLGRSTCEPGDITVDTQAEDALAVLDTVATGPADVFAHSGGALTCLALVAKHPGRLRTAVLLEPPLVELLPEAGRMREESAEVLDAYRKDGIQGAGAVFSKQSGLEGPPPDPGMMANLDVFFGQMYGPIGDFHADFDAVRNAATRVEIGVGTTSAGQVAHRAAVAVAARLGRGPVEFPGDHGGFGTDPQGTADVLRRLLS